MGVLVRLLFIGFLVYFVLRTIAAFGARTGKKEPSDVSGNNDRDRERGGIPKDIGEYVDYEEVNDD